MSFRVNADNDLCISAKECSALAPAVFGHDEADLVQVLDPEPPEGLRDAVRHAARICPSAAIRILEA
jgi:ferredoxin